VQNEVNIRAFSASIFWTRVRARLVLAAAITHNPNIAVVCDAEQIIHSSIDRADGSRITYTSGAIEDPIINKHVLDVLEGTRPAFDNRDAKYHT